MFAYKFDYEKRVRSLMCVALFLGEKGIIPQTELRRDVTRIVRRRVGIGQFFPSWPPARCWRSLSMLDLLIHSIVSALGCWLPPFESNARPRQIGTTGCA
ncbi:hypothetical protein EVAR_65094_1 [Eumeta japonica]|uniref:Uncharacterized protein n=1 Tax=Eumeta variegata TaxID=151549 RepID=A0A4C1Z007_EUMVA|nr:hypothetical protein EVAR_65094_1 [Eumeta japonica]